MPVLLFFFMFFTPGMALAYPATIAEVFDGDTLLTTEGEHIRLVNINTPEVAHDKTPAQPYGEEARHYMTQRVKGQKVEVKTARKKTDKYKRTLAEIFLKGQSLNEEMIAQGLAHVYTFPDNSENVQPLHNLEDAARRQRKGLWQSPRWQVMVAGSSVPDAWIGEFHIVEGTVRNVVPMKDRVYLNFGDNWRDDFTVEIPKKFSKQFAAQHINPAKDYRGKKLRVRGFLKPVNGVLVTATHPAQLEVIP